MSARLDKPSRAAWLAAGACGLAAALWAPTAAADNALGSPSAGVDQASRGGAWLARADSPMAAFFNPAAMARNPSGVHLGAQLMLRDYCFDRRNTNNERFSPGQGLSAPPGEVCADIPPFPNPQIAATFRVHKRFAFGVAALGPHAAGGASWPETIDYQEGNFGVVPHPSPSRYLLLKNDALALFPTVSVAWAPFNQLSFGAGFTWGLASFEFSNMAEAVSPVRPVNEPDEFSQDVRSVVSGFDGFIPGFVVSAEWSPTRWLDIAAWYRYSDKIDSDIDLRANSNFYRLSGSVDDANLNNPAVITDRPGAGNFQLAIPMQARVGFRYHKARRHALSQGWVRKHRGYARDPMSQDLFDIELDLTWAHNSQIDKIQIRMQPGIVIAGTPGTVPENADIPHNMKDVLGVRLGGEYVPIPDLLALRAGGFFESQGQDPKDLNLDFHMGWRAGVSGGVALRLSRFDITVMYAHTFFGTLDNEGQGAVKTLSGDATTGDFRTRQAVNGGSITSSLNEVGLGATVHF